jgi:hypothetical protein
MYDFYRCETLSFILREEFRLGKFENRMLRRIFERKQEEIKGMKIKLHNESIHGLYSALNIIGMIKSIRIN